MRYYNLVIHCYLPESQNITNSSVLSPLSGPSDFDLFSDLARSSHKGVYPSEEVIVRFTTPYWRLGTVTVEMFSIDQESSVSENNPDASLSSIKPTKPSDAKNTTNLSGIYVPCALQKSNIGIVHLFRDRHDLDEFTHTHSLDPSYSNLGEVMRKRSSSLSHTAQQQQVDNEKKKTARKQKKEEASQDTQLTTPEDIDRDTMVAVLAVPLYVTPHDFLRLMGASRLHLSHMRILRDALPFRFMILLKFKTAEYANSFYDMFNGRPFNSFEPEICHLVFLRSVKITWSTIPNDLYSFLTQESNSASSPKVSHKELLTILNRVGSSNERDVLNELPSCPVCLERMDASVTALLTVACHHTFHCHCLMKWRDSTCPVCRFSASHWIEEVQSSKTLSSNASSSNVKPSMGTSATRFGDSNECSECHAGEHLWICLICAHIGCGRYVGGHAHLHYETTQHVYALELETQRVWDYVGDGYVHRLIQNKADGKLVELPAASGMGSRWGLDAFLGGGSRNGGKWVESSVGGVVPSQKPVFSSSFTTRSSRNPLETKNMDDFQLELSHHTRSRSSPANAFVFSSEKDTDLVTEKLPLRCALDTLDPETALITPFDTHLSEKLESLGQDYAIQLQTQLESQRAWYERQLSKLEIVSAEQLALMDTRLASLMHTQRDLEHKLSLTLDHTKLLEKRLEKSQQLSKTLHKDLAEERIFNASLRENQALLETSIQTLKAESAKKDEKVVDLEEQVRDLMVFLETQQTIMKSDMKDELVNASVVGVGEPSTASPLRKKKTGKRK